MCYEKIYHKLKELELNMMALRDDEEDTMHGVHEEVEAGTQNTDKVCMVS